MTDDHLSIAKEPPKPWLGTNVLMNGKHDSGSHLQPHLELVNADADTDRALYNEVRH